MTRAKPSQPGRGQGHLGAQGAGRGSAPTSAPANSTVMPARAGVGNLSLPPSFPPYPGYPFPCRRAAPPAVTRLISCQTPGAELDATRHGPARWVLSFGRLKYSARGTYRRRGALTAGTHHPRGAPTSSAGLQAPPRSRTARTQLQLKLWSTFSLGGVPSA